MKKQILILGIIVLLLLSATPVSFASVTQTSPVTRQTKTISVDGRSHNVTVVWTDLNNPLVRVETAFAEGKVGKTAPLKTIVESSSNVDGKVLAGINGTFFSAYSDMQAEGTVIRHGEAMHLANVGSVFTVNQNNKADVVQGRFFIEGSTQNQWLWPFRWYAWNINHYYTTPEAVMVFDQNYSGPRPTHDFTAIKIDKGIVTDIRVGGFDIPSDGFLVLAKDRNVIDVFKKGYTADYRIRYEDSTKKDMNDYFANVRTAVGAGPTLLKDGVIIANASAEGFSETKITSNRAGRSIVGVRADGVMGMAVLSNVTVLEAAKIAKELGMVNAMNLDGGGSSALYANGSYVAGPGRNISNALVVRLLDQKPTTIKLNGQTLFFDAEPFVEKSVNRTVVPLRGIAEALGATVGWESATSSITLSRYGTVIKMKMGSSELDVNGAKTMMEMPVIQRLGRSFVPVRVITDLFGGEVGWDGATSTVSLTIGMVEDIMAKADTAFNAKQYDLAIEHYKKALAMDPSQINAVKQLATIYNTHKKDYPNAIIYYEIALKANASDIGVLNSLAWVYYSNRQFNESITTFEKLITLTPDLSGGYYGAALNYSHFAVQNQKMAVSYFEKALARGLSGDQKAHAEKYIKDNK